MSISSFAWKMGLSALFFQTHKSLQQCFQSACSELYVQDMEDDDSEEISDDFDEDDEDDDDDDEDEMEFEIETPTPKVGYLNWSQDLSNLYKLDASFRSRS